MGRGSSEPVKWWQARTNLEKTLLSFSITITLAFIILVLISATAQGPTSREEKNITPMSCQTSECLITAANILDKLNSSINPCEDFYEFSCGHYVRTHSVKVDNSIMSVDQTSVETIQLYLKQWLDSKQDSNSSSYENAKLLYNTCMKPGDSNEIYENTVNNIMQKWKLGNWPLLDPSSTGWHDSDTSLEGRLGNLTMIGVPIGFKLKVITDSQNPKDAVIQVSPGEPLLGFHEEHEIRESLMLRSYIEASLLLLGVSKHSVSGDVDDILSAEALFIRMKQKADQECDRPDGGQNNELRTERMTIEELDRRIPEIHWSTLIPNIMNGINKNENRESPIIVKEADVYCRKHIRDFIGFLQQLPTKDLYNYLGWRFLFPFLKYLGPPFYRLQSDYQNYISKESYQPLYQPRWKECLSLVERYFFPTLAKVYKENAIPRTLMIEKMKMASQVRQSFIDLLLSTKWIKDQDQQKIKQKVMASKFDTDAFKILSNWENHDAIFENLNLNSSHTLLETVLELQRHKTVNELLRLQNPSRESLDWDGLDLTTPFIPKFQDNSIPVYLDKYIPPYLQLQGPRYLNHGGFGSYLSRELLRYASHLNVSTMIENQRLKIFWELPRHIKDLDHCYSDKILSSETLQVNEDTIMSEVLSELSAIQVAHLTYDGNRAEDINLFGMHYNHEQIFFISYAQALCEVRDDLYSQAKWNQVPASVRVNFALKNFPTFGKVFNCPSESLMNPSAKCHILD